MTDLTVEDQARGSSVATNNSCRVCTKAGRAARFPCLLFITTVYGSFPVLIEECRVAGCNYKNVIAVSVSVTRDLTAELINARAKELQLRWSAKRNLMGAFIATFALVFVTMLLVLTH